MSNPTYKDLYQYFPVVDVTSKRTLNKDIALDLGYRVMRVRELFEATDRRRRDLLESHAKKDEKGNPVRSALGPNDPVERIIVEDQYAFDKAWQEMLDQEISDYPEWPKKIDPEKLPDEISGFEVEALLRLRLIKKPDVF